MIFHANTNERRAGVALLITGKNRHEVENCYKRQKKSIYDKRVNKSRRYNNINTYRQNIKAQKYMKLY